MSIQRQWELFRSVAPAFSNWGTRRFTAYFYRRQAIEWARLARSVWYLPEMQATARNLAKHYLAQYRQMKQGVVA